MVFRSLLERPHRTWLLIAFACCILEMQSGCRVLRRRAERAELDNARQLSLRGTDALDRDRYQDAELLFAEALQNCPNDERAQWGYAQTLWQRGATESAIEHMREAIRLSGKNAEYRVRLGEMYLAIGELQSAGMEAQNAINEDHRNAEAWSLMGNVHRSGKRWDRALDCYQRAMLLRPDFPEVQLSTAEAYRQLGSPQRSLATLDRMIDFHPTRSSTPDALIIRGLALADLGRSKEALAALNRASDKIPQDQPDQHVQLASAQYRLGDLVQARMSLGRALQSHPNHSEGKRLQSALDSSFEHLARPIPMNDATLFR